MHQIMVLQTVTLLRIILMFWLYETKFDHREDGGSKLWRNVWTNPKHYVEYTTSYYPNVLAS